MAADEPQAQPPREIVPGLVHWSAFHEGIGKTVFSSFLLGSRTLIDPMEPAGGLQAIESFATPRRVVLSNRHHYRHSARFARRFDCPVLCQQEGLADLGEERPAAGFSFDEQLAEDVRALEVGAICPEETALLLDLAPCALSFADGLTRGSDGALAFMPDRLLGEDPRGVRAGLTSNLRRLLDEDFDMLLFAHAEPILEDGHARLQAFLAEQPE